MIARSALWSFVGLCAILVALSWTYLMVSPSPLGNFGWGETWDALVAPLGLGSDRVDTASGASMQNTVEDRIWVLRMPRLLLGILAGAALAAAGTVMQAVFRNPLASPEIVGTTSGAALGGVIVLALGVQGGWVHAVPLASFAGAVVVTMLVFVFAGRGAQFSVTALLLAGIAINTLGGSLTSFVTALSFGDFNRSGAVMRWLMGGLDEGDWNNVASVAVGAGIFGLALVPLLRDMDVLTLPDDSAASLGVDAGRKRRVLVLIACGLTGATVANTGGITFVGLVVPHMTRLVVGPSHRRLLPCAAVMGAIVLVGAAILCRMAPPDANLRLGVVTSLLGAPFFLVLLARHRRGERV